MARYRRSASVLFTDGFRGLDATEGEKKNFSSSVYMKNFRITDQRRLKKRCGYKKLVSGINADSCFAAEIGGAVYFIYKKGVYLHALLPADGTDIVCNCNDTASAGYFMFGGKGYIIGFGLFYVFDGVGFSPVTPYIPTVATECMPSGGGVLYESLNVLSDKAKISYSPDGESVSFRLPPYAFSVVSVTENGQIIDSSSYSYDRRTNTLTFASAPGGGVPDSLQVTFRLSDGTVLGMPYIGGKFCIYGGDRDTRVFAYGEGNTLWYSDVTYAGADPTYFPADNFINVGDGTEKVTALIRHYDRLIVFTEGQTWFLSPSEVSYGGTTKPSFPVSPLNSVVGCAGGGAAYADNTPFTLAADGIYVFGQSTVRDERSAKRISDRVAPYLSPAFLESAFVYDHEYDKEIWMCCGGAALIYNYGVDAFYYYDNVPAVYVFGIGKNVAFYSGRDIYMFDEACDTDDDEGISAVYETGDVILDAAVKKRRLRRACMAFTAGSGARVKLRLIPNRGDTKQLVFSGAPYDGGFDFGALDFAHLSFLCGRKPVHAEMRIPISSFECLRIRIQSDGDDGGVTVSSVSLTVAGE